MNFLASLRTWILSPVNRRIDLMSAELEALKTALDAYKAEVATDVAALLSQVTDLTARVTALSTTNPDAVEMATLAADLQATTQALHDKVNPVPATE